MTMCVNIPGWVLVIAGILINIPSVWRVWITFSYPLDITARNSILFAVAVIGLCIGVTGILIGGLQYLPCIRVVP